MRLRLLALAALVLGLGLTTTWAVGDGERPVGDQRTSPADGMASTLAAAARGPTAACQSTDHRPCLELTRRSVEQARLKKDPKLSWPLVQLVDAAGEAAA